MDIALTVVGLGRADSPVARKIRIEERRSGVAQSRGLNGDDEVARPPPVVDRQLRQRLADQLPVLREVARGACRDAAEIEDLVQDVFEKALRSIETLDRTQSPRGWMVTILYRLHIDRCRQRARQMPHVPCEDEPLVAPEMDAAPAWQQLGADDVRQAAARLPAELRDTYTMFALDGLSYVEISAALGISKITVGTRILRARAQLKKLLTAELVAAEHNSVQRTATELGSEAI